MHPRNTDHTRHCPTVESGWSDKSIFAQMKAGLASDHGEKTTVMTEGTIMKAHLTATIFVIQRPLSDQHEFIDEPLIADEQPHLTGPI